MSCQFKQTLVYRMIRRNFSSVLPSNITYKAINRHEKVIEESTLPPNWYLAAYAKLLRLTHALRYVQQIDGILIYTSDSSIVTEDNIIRHAKIYSSIAREFIASPWMQKSMHEMCRMTRFLEAGERCSMSLASLTKVCDVLNISAQQRSKIRLTICPQITQHNIWRGALEQVIGNLKNDLDSMRCNSAVFYMVEQIVFSCMKLLEEVETVSESTTPSWMRPAPTKKPENPPVSRKWEEVVEMFRDLSRYIAEEHKLSKHYAKVEAMREGLYQIRDILIERDIGYKEARRQDCLVQKKLTKSLGHSSKCLFTLLMYYLYGKVDDIEVQVCGGIGNKNNNNKCLYIGKVLISRDEMEVMSGAKELSRALGVFKFVWETAEMKGGLELHGHLWCVGAQEKTFEYRGNVFFVHDINLCTNKK